MFVQLLLKYSTSIRIYFHPDTRGTSPTQLKNKPTNLASPGKTQVLWSLFLRSSASLNGGFATQVSVFREQDMLLRGGAVAMRASGGAGRPARKRRLQRAFIRNNILTTGLSLVLSGKNWGNKGNPRLLVCSIWSPSVHSLQAGEL